MKVYAFTPTLPSDRNVLSEHSVLNQTVKPAVYSLLLERGVGDSLPNRISNVLNRFFGTVDLEQYDYLLRVDSDTVLPPNFLEENLQQNADVVGYGHAHIIKISAFKEVMNCRFNSVSDDTYLNFKFMKEGYVWKYWNVKPVMLRRNGCLHGVKYYLERGNVMWVNGYCPTHVFGSVRWHWKNVVAVFSYFLSMVRRTEQLDVANYVFRYQMKKLFNDLTRKRRF